MTERRIFRTIQQGTRVVGGVVVPRGWPLEEFHATDKGWPFMWVLVDTLPPGAEAAKQYVKSVGGILKINNQILVA